MLVNSFLSSKNWNTVDIDVSWRSLKILCGFVSCVSICITYVYVNINQLDALNFLMSLFHASTCFEHMCSSSGGQNCTIQPLV